MHVYTRLQADSFPSVFSVWQLHVHYIYWDIKACPLLWRYVRPVYDSLSWLTEPTLMTCSSVASCIWYSDVYHKTVVKFPSSVRWINRGNLHPHTHTMFCLLWGLYCRLLALFLVPRPVAMVVIIPVKRGNPLPPLTGQVCSVRLGVICPVWPQQADHWVQDGISVFVVWFLPQFYHWNTTEWTENRTNVFSF